MVSKFHILLLIVALCMNIANAAVDDEDYNEERKDSDNKDDYNADDDIEDNECSSMLDKVDSYLTCCHMTFIYTTNVIAACMQHLEGGSLTNAACFTNCAIRTAGFFVGGKLNANKLESYLVKNFADDPELHNTTSEAFLKCNSIKYKYKESLSDIKPACRSGAVLSGCALQIISTNCPASLKVNTQECEDLRKYFKKCPMPLNPN